MSAPRSPSILSLPSPRGHIRTLAECLTEAFRGSLLRVLEFPHFRSGPKTAVEVLAVGPSLGCHIILRDSSSSRRATALKAVAATLRSAAIPARLPCRVWIHGEDGAADELLVATVTRAGRLPADRLEPIAARNALLQSIRSAGPLRSWQDRVSATQDALRLFREPVLTLTAAEPPTPMASGLSAEIARIKAEIQRAELDREQVLARASAWRRGARLVRGVAGSGKTCVMAWATAMLVRDLQADPRCQPPRMLVVSPFQGQLRDLATRVSGCLSIEAAASEEAAMPRWIRIGHWHQIAIQLARALGVKGAEAKPLLELEPALLEAVRAHPPSLRRWMFDAIVVDEAQALSDDAIRILAALGDPRGTGDPTVHLYFDDAQAAKLMDRRPPLWKRLGVRVQGRRSVLLDRCYRTPAETMEPAFNMLVGSLIGLNKPKTTAHADLERLCLRGLIEPRPDGWHSIRFAMRHGPDPEVRLVRDAAEGIEAAVRLADELVKERRVTPADIAIITHSEMTCRSVARVAARLKRTVVRLHARRHASRPDGASGAVALRSVNEVRGLEWPVVILVGWDELDSSPVYRSDLYIAMTRTQHMLYLITDAGKTLMRETKKCVDRARMIRLETALEGDA